MLDFTKKTVKKLTVWDMQFIKACFFFLGFFVAAYLSKSFLYDYRWLWLALTILFAIKPIYTAFSKK